MELNYNHSYSDYLKSQGGVPEKINSAITDLVG